MHIMVQKPVALLRKMSLSNACRSAHAGSGCGAGDDELVECAIEAGGQLVDGIVTLVGVRDEILAIVDRPHDRLTGRLVEEHLRHRSKK